MGGGLTPNRRHAIKDTFTWGAIGVLDGRQFSLRQNKRVMVYLGVPSMSISIPIFLYNIDDRFDDLRQFVQLYRSTYNYRRRA